MKAGDEISMSKRKDVADVKRAADGGRRRVDRIHLVARARAIEAVRAGRLPLRRPLGLEAFEGRLFGYGHPKIVLQNAVSGNWVTW